MKPVHLTIFLILTMIVIACSTPAGSPTSLPNQALFTETALPESTNTPPPTRTPIPPTPTVTAPDILIDSFSGIEVIYYDSFNTDLDWGIGCACIVINGELVVNGKDWNGLSWERQELSEGQGIIIDFTYSEPVQLELYLDHDEFATDSYQRFGVYIESTFAEANLWQGSTLISGRLIGNFTPQPGVQYSLAMMVGQDGEFMAILWDTSDPSKTISTREQKGSSWFGHTWGFAIGANQGNNILFDNLRLVQFEEIK